ncbi:hypothetical protein BGZ76_006718 [Entomortierella beljakovae]|nr:hypothetical protein BGZ76_006718 [Entomortierella beljakovae]
MAIQQTTTEDKLSVSAKDTSSSSSSSCDSPSSPSTLDVDFSHDNKKSDSVENSNTTQTLILSSCLPADESNSGMNRTATVDQKFQESGKSIEAMEDHESPDCAKKIIFSSPEQQQQQQRQVQSNNLVQGSKVQQEQEQPPLPPRPQSSPLSEQQPRFDHNIAMSQFDFVSTNHTSLEGTSDSLIPKSLDHPIMILNGQVSVQAFLSTAMTTVTDIPWNLVTSFSSTLNPPLPPPASMVIALD